MPPVWLLAKENHHLLGPKLVASWLNYLPPSVGPQVFLWQSKRMESSAIMTLTVSNVPGPGNDRRRDHRRDLLCRSTRGG